MASPVTNTWVKDCEYCTEVFPEDIQTATATITGCRDKEWHVCASCQDYIWRKCDGGTEMEAHCRVCN